jgi:hypothetical protein
VLGRCDRVAGGRWLAAPTLILAAAGGGRSELVELAAVVGTAALLAGERRVGEEVAL